MAEIGSRNLNSPSQCQPLLFLQSNDDEKIAFSSIHDPKNHIDIKPTPAELRGKKIQAFSTGWFILLDIEINQNSFFREMNYSLWNPLTSEFICLPPLTLKSEQEINGCIMSSAPGNPDCMLILFEKKDPSIIRILIGSNHWHHQRIEEESDYMSTFVMCNGTLYCRTFKREQLVKIDPSIMPYLSVKLFNNRIPRCLRHCDMVYDYMVESWGKLFLIYLIKRESYPVISVRVFKLSLENMICKEVESIKDRAFFVSSQSSFSCLANEPEVKGNHVYFMLPRDKSLYSFNMGDKTVSASLPSNLWRSPIWIMPDLRLWNIQRQLKDDLHVERKAIKPIEYRAMVEQVEGKFVKLPLNTLFEVGKRLMPQAFVNFCTANTSVEFAVECLKKCKTLISWRKDEGNFKLPLDVLFAIGKCLMPQDFMNFRAVSTSSRLAVECLKERKTLIPWLMVWERDDSCCNCFIDLWGERYPMDIPCTQLKDASMFCSKSGWCLMLQENRSVLLWNPFISKVTNLPDSPHKRESYTSFLSSTDYVVLMGFSHCHSYSFIDYIFLEKGTWHSFICPIDSFYEIMRYNTLTYCNGIFYCLSGDRQLYSFEESTGLRCLDSAIKPHSMFIYQSFLVECDGKLLLVFVGFMGGWVRIFRLCDLHMTWVEIESLDNHTLYVSRNSSFSTTATSGMANRIYFSRFYGKSVIYYSLESKKLHTHCTGKVLGNFYDTKEQLYSSWIQPKWV